MKEEEIIKIAALSLIGALVVYKVYGLYRQRQEQEVIILEERESKLPKANAPSLFQRAQLPGAVVGTSLFGGALYLRNKYSSIWQPISI